VIYTDPRLKSRGITVGHKSSSGARQWVDVNYYEDVITCVNHVRSKYDAIYGTHLSEESVSLYDLVLTKSVALAFGNEHAGMSSELLSHLDANFTIPQHGFVQSLNISVACAVSLYEAQRQRLGKQMYDRSFGEIKTDEQLLIKYREVHSNKKLREG